MNPQFTYKAKMVKVIDGDTIDVVADLGFNCMTKLRLRLYGLNAPEMREPEGVKARDALRDLLPANCDLVIKTFKDPGDKYGRWLAVVYEPGTKTEINLWLLNNGFARLALY